jgi:hypothetical protein
MFKILALTPWLMLFLSAQGGAAPTVIQPPLLDQGATALAVHQSDDITAGGQINVASTDSAISFFPPSPSERPDHRRRPRRLVRASTIPAAAPVTTCSSLHSDHLLDID